MSEINRILDHYDDVLNGEPWHGDPIWQILDGISGRNCCGPALGGRSHHLGDRDAHDVLGRRGDAAARRQARRAWSRS